MADPHYRTESSHQDPVGRFDMAVVGLGYVGLPLASAASQVGLRVLGVDVDPAKVEALNAGRSYIDDIEDKEVATALEAGFVATTDEALLQFADAISISVPTPLNDGVPDLTAVVAASRSVGRNLVSGQLVIFGSTTYPGTTDEVVLPLLEAESGLQAGSDFDLAYSPERIDPANKTWGVRNTPKLVAGYTQEAANRASALLNKFCAETIMLSGVREAEMAKLIENTYRQVNIALMNEMLILSETLKVDIWEAIRGAASKPFGFQPFYPGPGVGGHCIPIDPGYLSHRVRQLGRQARFVELAQEINDSMPRFVVARAAAVLDGRGVAIEGAEILLLGVSYKQDVGDTRNTPASAIVAELRALRASVTYADPLVPEFLVGGEPVERAADPARTAAAADLVILHTPHNAFDLDAIRDAAPALLDTRGVITGPNAHRI